MTEEMLDGFIDTVVLMDENGEQQEFEVLDGIQTDDARYIALLPIFENPEEAVDSDGELLIMRVEEEDGGEVYVTIDDAEEYEDILSIFEERLSEFYEIDHLDE